MLAHRPSSTAQDAHALMGLVRAGLFVLSNPAVIATASLPATVKSPMPLFTYTVLSHPPRSINTPIRPKQKLPEHPEYAHSLCFLSFLKENTHTYISSKQSPLSIPRPLLDPEPRLRLPQLLHLRVRQALLDLLHIDQLFHGEDLTRDVGRDGVVDGAHALVQAERFEHAAGFAWQADGGAHEGDAEEGGCCGGGHGWVWGGCDFGGNVLKWAS